MGQGYSHSACGKDEVSALQALELVVKYHHDPAAVCRYAVERDRNNIRRKIPYLYTGGYKYRIDISRKEIFNTVGKRIVSSQGYIYDAAVSLY